MVWIRPYVFGGDQLGGHPGNLGDDSGLGEGRVRERTGKRGILKVGMVELTDRFVGI